MHVASLWIALGVAPAAWGVQTIANLSLSSHACYPRLVPLDVPMISSLGATLFAISVGAVLASAFATVLAVRNWRASREEHQQHSGAASASSPQAALAETGEGRTRFMAFAGVLASSTFLLACSVQIATIILVTPCAAP
ncbi:MAG: hypothetical protein ABIQ10_11405 [Gemmatimonadaceae bacterium]